MERTPNIFIYIYIYIYNLKFVNLRLVADIHGPTKLLLLARLWIPLLLGFPPVFPIFLARPYLPTPLELLLWGMEVSRGPISKKLLKSIE